MADKKWISMGSIPGLDGRVNAIVVDGTRVYAAGYFTLVESSQAKIKDAEELAVTVAVWDGSHWTSIAKYANCGEVTALALAIDRSLYATNFRCADDLNINGIAKWDGHKWTQVGSDVDGDLKAIHVDKAGNLYVAGTIAKNEEQVGFVKKWDGTRWTQLSKDYFQGLSIAVNALVSDYQGSLYAVGSFDEIGGLKAHNVAKWDGKKWKSLGRGIGGKRTEENESLAWSIAADSKGDVYAISTLGLEKWNGKSWKVVNTKTDALGSILIIDRQDRIYLGLQSTCDVEGGLSIQTTKPIQFWDGKKWSAFHFNGSNSGTAPGCAGGGSISALALGNDDSLVVGGSFTETTTGARNIAKWNGQKWESFGVSTGVNDYVEQIVVDLDDNLYVRGSFTRVDQLLVKKNQIAHWNSDRWNLLSPTKQAITSMALDTQGRLYVAVGEHPSGSSILKMEGGKWKPVTQIDYLVRSMTIDEKANIYTCGLTGDITDHYGDIKYHGVDRWDGKNWKRISPESMKVDHNCWLKKIEDKIIHVSDEDGSWRWNGKRWLQESDEWKTKTVLRDPEAVMYLIDRDHSNEGKQTIRAWNTRGPASLGFTSHGDINSIIASKKFLYIGGSFSLLNHKSKPYLARIKLFRDKEFVPTKSE
ncbi:hypothetical protein [Undibacterium sp. Ji22W]|uniref:hypothetical protein n=1 Tax=Undibacterium sp. Ji22W TaxID=3413038 RepID=UPI003BF450DD